jgi:glycosyltransferase domain-containing protein
MTTSPITFVMPTRNRSHFVERTLNYLAKIEFPYALHICDNSESPQKELLRSIVTNFANTLKLEFVDFDSQTDSLSKVVICLKSVSTEYCAFIGDDDFPIVSTYELMADSLRKFAHLNCVDGTEIRVALPGSTITTDQAYSAIVYPQPDIQFRDSCSRLLAHFSQYWPTWYALHRTRNITDQFACAIKNNINILGVELLASGLALIDGSYKKLPQIHLVRQIYHESSTKFASWKEMSVDASYQPDFLRLQQELSIRLKQKGVFNAFADACSSAAVACYMTNTVPQFDFTKSEFCIGSTLNGFNKKLVNLLHEYFKYRARKIIQPLPITGLDGNVNLYTPSQLKELFSSQKKDLELIESFFLEKS